MTESEQVSLDIVIPVFNEEAVLDLLLGRLGAVFDGPALAASRISAVRYIFVDDGSTDGTAEALRRGIDGGLPAELVRFSRNFGHQAAVSAGLDRANAQVVAVIDSDLQDPPELLHEMLAKWREGYDVVFAQRRRRKEGPVRRFGYWAFYRLVAFLSEIDVPLDSGDFSLMGANVVGAMRQLPERLRFPRGLRAWVGFRQTGVEYDRPPRAAGEPKYNLGGLYRLATDGVASLSIRPLRLAQLATFTYALVTLFLIGIVLIQLLRSPELDGRAMFLIGYVLIAGGNFVIAACLYVIGAYVGRAYLETKGRPTYIVASVHSAVSPK